MFKAEVVPQAWPRIEACHQITQALAEGHLREGHRQKMFPHAQRSGRPREWKPRDDTREVLRVNNGKELSENRATTVHAPVITSSKLAVTAISLTLRKRASPLLRRNYRSIHARLTGQQWSPRPTFAHLARSIVSTGKIGSMSRALS